jgi:hypothetical protein
MDLMLLLSEIGSVVGLGEGQAAALAFEVIEHSCINFFTHSRSSQSAGSAPRQAAKNCSGNASEGDSNRPCNRAYGCAALCA